MLLLALSIIRKSTGRLSYLQMKFSSKTQYNSLDLLFMSKQIRSFELKLTFKMTHSVRRIPYGF